MKHVTCCAYTTHAMSTTGGAAAGGKYDSKSNVMIWFTVFDNGYLVDTRWQQYSTHLHMNNTQNNTMKHHT